MSFNSDLGGKLNSTPNSIGNKFAELATKAEFKELIKNNADHGRGQRDIASIDGKLDCLPPFHGGVIDLDFGGMLQDAKNNLKLTDDQYKKLTELVAKHEIILESKGRADDRGIPTTTTLPPEPPSTEELQAMGEKMHNKYLSQVKNSLVQSGLVTKKEVEALSTALGADRTNALAVLHSNHAISAKDIQVLAKTATDKLDAAFTDLLTSTGSVHVPMDAKTDANAIKTGMVNVAALGKPERAKFVQQFIAADKTGNNKQYIQRLLDKHNLNQMQVLDKAAALGDNTKATELIKTEMTEHGTLISADGKTIIDIPMYGDATALSKLINDAIATTPKSKEDAIAIAQNIITELNYGTMMGGIPTDSEDAAIDGIVKVIMDSKATVTDKFKNISSVLASAQVLPMYDVAPPLPLGADDGSSTIA